MIYGKLNVHNTSYFQEYLIPFNHIVFKSTAFSVYLYIFQRIHKDRKSDDGLKNCLRNNTQEKTYFIRYLVSLWIIIYFILFIKILIVMLLTYFSGNISSDIILTSNKSLYYLNLNVLQMH